MAEKPDTKEGIAAGAVYWIFFMLVFRLLGYTNFLSILLGAIAGLATGVMAAWWSPKAEPRRKTRKIAKTTEAGPEVVEEEVEAPAAAPLFREYGAFDRRPRKRREKNGRFFSRIFRRG